MKSLKIFGSFLLSLLMTGMALGATVKVSGAQGSWTEVLQTGGAFTVNYKNTPTQLVATPYQGLDGTVWFYDANLTQNPDYIKNVVVERYELGVDTLELAVACNAGDRNCAGADLGGTGGIYTFTADKGFHYLAIHLGKAELLFHWADAITSFSLSGLPGGSLSNYRAFVDLTVAQAGDVLATPLPGAALLFASALGFGGVVRRRSPKSST